MVLLKNVGKYGGASFPFFLVWDAALNFALPFLRILGGRLLKILCHHRMYFSENKVGR
jgi:hypothetical protein